mmetsp:Transcript_14106/g.11656  ORF Transcript_14106/g.11656 Transcript_14106/m.11656 type:complete len:257 (+) Transcript_14106:414-1184(+)
MQFEKQEYTLIKQNKETMKIIHDLKNPLIAVQTILKYADIAEDLLSLLNFELDDMKEMLEVLRFEFKSKNGMSLEENKGYKQSKEFIESLANTHKSLAENGNNALLFSLSQFPDIMYIPVSIIKRILNNLISNALKHTKDGIIKVRFNQVSEIDTFSQGVELIHKGANPDPLLKYLRVEIEDNGQGIPAEILNRIFDEMVSDENGNNWDGTGLGLPICLKLASSANCFIKYGSILGQKTLFQFYFPFLSKKGDTID